ncbi:MAG: transporter [Luteolibacter sp.]
MQLRPKTSHHFFRLTLWLIAIFLTLPCTAQELVPRRWSHLPMDMNFTGAGYAYTTGDIAFNPLLLIEDGELTMQTFVSKYIRTFEVFEKSARFDIAQAYQSGKWTGLLDGVSASTERNGLRDTVVRLAINLFGGPPLKGKEFAEYRANTSCETIVGLGLAVQIPTGSYYKDKLINLGTNRFTFHPQLGIVHNRGKWSMELTTSAWFFTDNDSFRNGNRLEQDPLLTAQAHVNYTFRPGLWIGTGIGYGFNGESAVNGSATNDPKSNLVWAISAGLPINRQLGVKIGYIGLRTKKKTGADLDTFSIGISALW